ncbi:hypothetical protein NHJ13734_007677 [Beauveria thailandica]
MLQEHVAERAGEARGGEIKITEQILKAAAGNARSGKEGLSTPIEERRDGIKTTKEVVKTATRNKTTGQQVVGLVLKKRWNNVNIAEVGISDAIESLIAALQGPTEPQ